MNKIALFFVLVIISSADAQEFGFPNNDPNYYLSWSDEFNATDIDLTKWKIETVVVSTNGGDPNPGYCTDRPINVRLTNGKLFMTALREDYWVNGVKYYFTGGSIISRSHQNVGAYIESYAKLGQDRGLSAFWTWEGNGNCGQWLGYREIDIIEWFASEQKGNHNIHWCTGIGQRETYPDENVSIDNNASFLHFSTYWNSQNISTYRDQKITNTPKYDLNNALRSPMYLIYWSIKHPWYIYPLHSVFEIDYVRVWRLKSCDLTDIVDVLDFNTFNYSLKKSITLTSSTIIPLHQNISLRAIDFIELKEGFEFPNSSMGDIVLNTNLCE